MLTYHEIGTEPGIYLFCDKDNRVLYVGRSDNLRARLRQHKTNHERVAPWIQFFDEQFEKLNMRITEAFKRTDSNLFDEIFGIVGWPLALIDSTLPIDCAYDSVGSVNIDRCPNEELDRKESSYVSRLKPPFNYQHNSQLPDSERWKYFPRGYLKVKALSKLLSHHQRTLAVRMLDKLE
jgi:predicted GIY-YIG superfamily endonuclease